MGVYSIIRGEKLPNCIFDAAHAFDADISKRVSPSVIWALLDGHGIETQLHRFNDSIKEGVKDALHFSI